MNFPIFPFYNHSNNPSCNNIANISTLSSSLMIKNRNNIFVVNLYNYLKNKNILILKIKIFSHSSSQSNSLGLRKHYRKTYSEFKPSLVTKIKKNAFVIKYIMKNPLLVNIKTLKIHLNINS